MASIWEVAKAANVAPSTVSLVVNHRDRVSEATRKRVEEAIKRMGYRARGRQRRPAQRRSLNLVFLYSGVALVDNTLGSYCRDLIDGVRQGLTEKSSSLNTHRSLERVDDDPVFLDQLEAGDFDGALLVGAEPRSGYVDRLLDLAVPTILFNRFPNEGEFSAVTVDYHGAGKIAMQHLAELGHHRVIVPRPAQDHEQDWYRQSFHRAATTVAAEAGVEVIIEAGAADADADRIDAQRAEALCRQAMDARATAFCGGDRLAALILRGLGQMGVDVPRQFSVLGIDHLGLTSPEGLPLTSIGYNKQLMGMLAGQLIERLVASPDVQFLTAGVKCSLVSGKTTAEAPSK